MNNKQCHFEDLLEEYFVIIPGIQRDYVQGRPSDRKNIAEPFVESLFSALLGSKKLCLDFIYGMVRKEEQGENNRLFLLDGQQRVTTLFLLYYYLCLRTKNKQESQKLLRFSYQTRIISRDFCRLLVENLSQTADLIGPAVAQEQNLGDIIRQSAWFFIRWEEDPSVCNMLSMLTVIHSVAGRLLQAQSSSKFAESRLAACLNNFKQIQFSYMELSNVEDEYADDLYLKMNSRGKQLTVFEIFKSRLSKCLIEDEPIKLDGDWYNFFWQLYRDETSFFPEKVDQKICCFVENMTWFFVNDNAKEKAENALLLDASLYKKGGIYGTRTDQVACLTKTWARLPELEKNSEEYKAFTNFLKPSTPSKEEKEITYQERLLFYSLVLYFQQSSHRLARKRWFRVCRNLIQNTLYNDIKSVLASKAELEKMAADVFAQETADAVEQTWINILQNLKSFGAQAEEEALKLELINHGQITENDLGKMELHPYFNGKIDFLLDFAKTADNTYDLEQFKRYYQLADLFFREENFIYFQKALLCVGDATGDDYLMPIASRYSLGNLNEDIRSKKDTWHKVFDNKSKRNLLKNLCENILNRIKEKEIIAERVRKELTDMVEEHLKQGIKPYADWRYWFLKEDSILARKEIRFRDARRNIYLQGGKGSWSKKYELYSYTFSLWCDKENRGLEWKDYAVKEGYGAQGPYLPGIIELSGGRKIYFNLFYFGEWDGFVLFAFAALPENWEEKISTEPADVLNGKVYKKTLGRPSFEELATQLLVIREQIWQLGETVLFSHPAV